MYRYDDIMESFLYDDSDIFDIADEGFFDTVKQKVGGFISKIVNAVKKFFLGIIDRFRFKFSKKAREEGVAETMKVLGPILSKAEGVMKTSIRTFKEATTAFKAAIDGKDISSIGDSLYNKIESGITLPTEELLKRFDMVNWAAVKYIELPASFYKEAVDVLKKHVDELNKLEKDVRKLNNKDTSEKDKENIKKASNIISKACTATKKMGHLLLKLDSKTGAGSSLDARKAEKDIRKSEAYQKALKERNK